LNPQAASVIGCLRIAHQNKRQKVQFARLQQAAEQQNMAITTLKVKIVGGIFLCIHRRINSDDNAVSFSISKQKTRWFSTSGCYFQRNRREMI
jgi:hypothetical protein